MREVRGRRSRSVGWARVALATLLLGLAAGPARAQDGSEISKAGNKSLESYEEMVAFSITTFQVIVIVGVVVVLTSVAAGLYLRWTATTDPEKLARSDPWVQRNLDLLNTRPADG